MRIARRTVGGICERLAAEAQRERDLLANLRRIGIERDQLSPPPPLPEHRGRPPHGRVVWCPPGRSSATLAGFFHQLGDRKHSIRAVPIDLSGEY